MTGITVQGRVRVRAHAPGVTYHRGLLAAGELLVDERNAIQSAGLAYIATMLLADPVSDPMKYGITEIALLNGSNVEVYKEPLTDQYTSGGSVTSVLFVPTIQPASQPVTIAGARLYLDSPAVTLLATKTFSPTISKTALLALTVDWTVTFAA